MPAHSGGHPPTATIAPACARIRSRRAGAAGDRAADPRPASSARRQAQRGRLSERLGVSRGPVREAFRVLEEAGLVRLEKNRGVFVREIRVEEADEIYELRAVLDELVGPPPCQRASRASDEGAARHRRAHGCGGARRDADAYHRSTCSSTTGWSSSPATRKLAERLPPAGQRVVAVPARTSTEAGSLPHSAARAPRRSSKAIAARRPAAAGPRDVRPRDRQPRAHASHGERARTAPRRGAPRRQESADRMIERQRPALPVARSDPPSSSASTAANPTTSHQAVGRRHAPCSQRIARRRHRAHRRLRRAVASPTRTTCRSSPARRRRCTASAATTSTTATPARK